MLTRCPACETAFRVTPEQLKARQGKVRCGECQHVFNALETLVEESTIVISPPANAVDASAPSVTKDADTETAVPPAPSLEGSSEPPPETAPAKDAEPDAEPNTEPVPEPALPPVAEAATHEWQPSAPHSPHLAHLPPAFEPLLHDLPVAAARPGWLWVSGFALMTLALVIQVVMHFRVELAVLTPSSRSTLKGLCGVFGCTVGLPSNVELMTIESSDLQPDPEQKDVLILTATLRNRAPFAQQFPHLELSLTDATDKAMVRRILTPADYLPHGNTVENIRNKGLATGELSISLPLNSGQIGASGYRLYLFYP